MGPHSSGQFVAGTATRTEPAADRVRAALDSLRRIVRDLRRGEAEYAAGLSVAQRFVLQLLADRPATSVNQLAERTLTDQSSVSVVVTRLARRKLIVRKPSPLDVRRTEVRLTPAGRKLLEGLPDAGPPRLLGALRGLPATDLRKLVAGLTAVVEQMGIEDAPATMFSEKDARTARASRRIGSRRGA